MILVTGASGFIGNALVERLSLMLNTQGVVAAIRCSQISWSGGGIPVVIGDLLPNTDWSVALKNITAVVHCAARVHVLDNSLNNSIDDYRKVNVAATLNLAQQAAYAGVRRFVFVSSIKVNGEFTKLGCPFTADDIPAPQDPYGISKMEAEQGLRELSLRTGMEVVIVRPPLVYGPGVKANFASMLRWLALGVPLPLGSIRNVRSMVALDNLVDMLITCLNHRAAAGQTFLVSDDEDVSTTALLYRTARSMGINVRLLPVPCGFIKLGAAMIGQGYAAQRLCSSLQVDIEKTRRLLDWQPIITLDQGIIKTVKGMKI